MEATSVGYTGDCQLWHKGLNRQGYGEAWYEGKKWLAHRLNYTLEKGKIPDGLELDHLCENKSCVNVDHLEAVTHQENIARHFAKNARNNNRCNKGHDLTPENTYKKKDGRRRCPTCRREYDREWKRKNKRTQAE